MVGDHEFFFVCDTGVCTQCLRFESLRQPFFVMGFFKIEYHELFAQAEFQPPSS
jgi:hypothetical protein